VVLKPRPSRGAGRCPAYRKNLVDDPVDAQTVVAQDNHSLQTLRAAGAVALEITARSGHCTRLQKRRGRGTGSMQTCDRSPTSRAFLSSGGEPPFAVSCFGQRDCVGGQRGQARVSRSGRVCQGPARVWPTTKQHPNPAPNVQLASIPSIPPKSVRGGGHIPFASWPGSIPSRLDLSDTWFRALRASRMGQQGEAMG